MNLSKDVDITRVMDSVSAGTDDTQSSDILDMQGWDGVLFVALLGDVTATAVITLQAQQNTANSASGMATLSGTSSQDAAGASDQDDLLMLLDLYRPEERYIRAQVVRATANVEIDGVIAIRYRGVKKPITQGSTVLDTTLLRSPDEA